MNVGPARCILFIIMCVWKLLFQFGLLWRKVFEFNGPSLVTFNRNIFKIHRIFFTNIF